MTIGIIVKGVIRLYRMLQNGVQARDGVPHLLLLTSPVFAGSSLFAGAQEYEKTAQFLCLVAEACSKAADLAE